MKSNKFLKVTGILMIISGGLGIIFGLIAVLGAGVVAAVANEIGLGQEINLSILIFASVLSLISGIVSLIAGILGVKNAAKPEKATVCIVFGILTAVLSVLGNVLTVVAGSNFSPVNLVLGLVVPVLYLIGAFQNKNQSNQPQPE